MSDLNSPFKPLNSKPTRPTNRQMSPRGTMNRPGADSLNSSAPATAAAQAFAKEQETPKAIAPAITFGFTPSPVAESKEENKEPSPFKPIAKSKGPIKRSDSINQAKQAAEVKEEKPIFAPMKEEPKGPGIAKFNESALDSLPPPDFAFDPEKARAKSIAARQTATELKFTPFDESQVQHFGAGTYKPSLQERIEANNQSELAFTPIADKDAPVYGDLGHKPSLQERINSNTKPAIASATIKEEKKEETAKEPASPFKPMRTKPAFQRPSEEKSAPSINSDYKSPFAPRRSDD